MMGKLGTWSASNTGSIMPKFTTDWKTLKENGGPLKHNVCVAQLPDETYLLFVADMLGDFQLHPSGEPFLGEIEKWKYVE